MAIKGIVTIDAYALYDNQTFEASFSLCDSGHHVVGLLTSSAFDGTELATAINGAVRTVAVDYLTNTWSGSFNPVTDTIKIVNPAQIL